jgi:hypothetical protein
MEVYMSGSRKEEDRFLSADEREFVAESRHPAVKGLPDADLAGLRKRLRTSRDKARDVANRQRREMRGKAPPSGREAASGDSGTRRKSGLLAAALKRVNKETERRATASGRERLAENAHRALRLKQAAGEPQRPPSRSADEGMRPLPNQDIAPSGALHAEGHRPVLERSRKVR